MVTLNDARTRFWSRVIKTYPDECWLWTGATNNHGYGQIYVKGQLQYAHRFSYELQVRPIPDGLELDHLCRTPACVNYRHLEPVTHRTNVLRGVSPSAQHALKTHCPKGHSYDVRNTYINPTSGSRSCRECAKARLVGNRAIDRTYCPNGHKYNLVNTYIAPNGSRKCKRCRNTSSARYREKKKNEGAILPGAPSLKFERRN